MKRLFKLIKGIVLGAICIFAAYLLAVWLFQVFSIFLEFIGIGPEPLAPDYFESFFTK